MSADDSAALAKESEDLLRDSRWAEGLAVADQLIVTYGDTEFAQRLRFVALRNLERNPEAIDAARAAIRLSPHNANAHYLLATALWTLTPPDSEGLTHVQRAIDLDPDVPLYRSLLARMVFETNPDYAEQLLRVIVRDTPDDAKALNDLGVLL